MYVYYVVTSSVLLHSSSLGNPCVTISICRKKSKERWGSDGVYGKINIAFLYLFVSGCNHNLVVVLYLGLLRIALLDFDGYQEGRKSAFFWDRYLAQRSPWLVCVIFFFFSLKNVWGMVASFVSSVMNIAVVIKENSDRQVPWKSLFSLDLVFI